MTWERRDYFCSSCKATARGFYPPMGWLRLSRRTNDPSAPDVWKMTGFYCGLRCALDGLERLVRRQEAIS